jgi:hypothetical protein
VLWAAIAGVLLLIAGVIAWLLLHGPLLRVLRRLWLSDLAAAWLAYAAGYHLLFLPQFRPVLGEAPALWGLGAALSLYALLRVLPGPWRRPELLLALAVLSWGGVLAAGQQYVDETAADAALLAEQPAAVLNPLAPQLRPLRRALLLSRLDADTRAATEKALALLQGAVAPHPDDLTLFRVAHLPVLRELYARDLAKLRTYQWVQAALLFAVLLLWAFGTVPDWETL